MPVDPEDEFVCRERVYEEDPRNIRIIVESTGFFSPDEVDIAVELAVTNLRQGDASGYSFLFLDVSGRTVGYTCFGPIPATRSSYDLYWIAVHHDYQGFGIGKEMLRRTEALIRARKGSRIYVETSSREQYVSTRRFYEASGYRQEAFLHDFYAPGDSKVIYVKVLEWIDAEGAGSGQSPKDETRKSSA